MDARFAVNPGGSVEVLTVSYFPDRQFGWLQGTQKSLKRKDFLVGGADLNWRPSGYAIWLSFRWESDCTFIRR